MTFEEILLEAKFNETLENTKQFKTDLASFVHSLIFFFEGLYSQKIKTLKSFKIKNKENKISAVPASIADLFRCIAAKVSTHVQSQTKLIPPLNGKTVIQSGRDPSPLSNPRGSRTDGRPAF